MGYAKQSPGAWPGTRRSTDCNANCGVGTRSPIRTPVADGLCRSRRALSQSEAFATPVNDQVLIYTSELKEAIVYKFLAQGNYAIARHHCDLNLQPYKVPDVITL